MVRRTKALLVSVVTHTLFLYGIYILWSVIEGNDKQESTTARDICVKLSRYEMNKEPFKPQEEERPESTPSPKIPPKKTEPPVVEQKKTEEIQQKPMERKIPKKTLREIEPIKSAQPPKPSAYEAEPPKETPLNMLPPEPFISPLDTNKRSEQFTIPKEENIAAEYAKINMQKILSLIKENLYYPLSARKRGVQGSVKIRFTLDKDARVCDVRVIEAQSEILGRAAIKTLEGLSGKFVKPRETITVTLPISYILN